MRGIVTPVGFITFILAFLYFGGFVPLLIALLVSSAISYVVRTFITNKRLPVPPTGAVLVTGAARGIGNETALHLSNLGFYVFAGVRTEEDGNNLKKDLRGNSDKIIPVILDVSVEESIQHAFAFVEQELKDRHLSLVGLVNNAGYSETGVLEILTPERMRRQFDVNVVGTVRVTQVFLPLLRQNKTSHKSRVVIIGSVLGKFAVPLVGLYSCSKQALEGVGDSFRLELKKWNIHTSILNVGKVNTANFFKVSAETRERNLQEARERAERQKQDEAHKSKLDPEVLQLYEAASERLAEEQLKMDSNPITVVADKVASALLDEQPLPRYIVGKDANFGVPLFTLLPEGISDKMIALWK